MKVTWFEERSHIKFRGCDFHICIWIYYKYCILQFIYHCHRVNHPKSSPKAHKPHYSIKLKHFSFWPHVQTRHQFILKVLVRLSEAVRPFHANNRSTSYAAISEENIESHCIYNRKSIQHRKQVTRKIVALTISLVYCKQVAWKYWHYDAWFQVLACLTSTRTSSTQF